MMRKNNEIVITYDSTLKSNQMLKISLKLSNRFGYVDDAKILFARHYENYGETGVIELLYNSYYSSDDESTFDASIKLDILGYVKFCIKLVINHRVFYINCFDEMYSLSEEMAKTGDFFIYDCNFSVPDWVKGAIVYQIFVDTFCKKDQPKWIEKKLVPWNAEPKWKPDDDGVYRNNQFYGGNLKGIIDKLDHIKSLSASIIYLTPIFKSPSSNRYDISDYDRIDEMVGSWEELDELHQKANSMGIKIILDIVINHSSIENVLVKEDAGLYKWNNDGTIKTWWGYSHLPEFEQTNIRYKKFVVNFILKTKYYVDGYRFDVADSLLDEILILAYSILGPEGFYMLLEVWKDGVIGDYRGFLNGTEGSGQMNYQFPDAFYRYVVGKNYLYLKDRVNSICRLYPPDALSASTIHLSSHDIPRVPNMVSGMYMHTDSSSKKHYWDMEKSDDWKRNNQFITYIFRKWEYENDIIPKTEEIMGRMRVVVFMQYTFPGIPSIFAGDEAGVMGFKDPFNRKPFPWDNIDMDFYNLYVSLGKFRKQNRDIFASDSFEILDIDEEKILYKRCDMYFLANITGKKIRIAENLSIKTVFTLGDDNFETNKILMPYQIIAFLLR